MGWGRYGSSRYFASSSDIFTLTASTISSRCPTFEVPIIGDVAPLSSSQPRATWLGVTPIRFATSTTLPTIWSF